MERAQRIAAKAVRRVLAGADLTAALAEAHGAAGGERALVHELAYGTLRFLGQLRASVRHLADRPLVDASVEALLWVALYQLVHTQAPPHAVVDSAVRATARLNRTSAKGLVNAVLRNFLRRREAVLSAVERRRRRRVSPIRAGGSIASRRSSRSASAAVLDAGNARPPL